MALAPHMQDLVGHPPRVGTSPGTRLGWRWNRKRDDSRARSPGHGGAALGPCPCVQGGAPILRSRTLAQWMQKMGMLGSALAGGRDWSSIKQRGAVTRVLSCLQGAGERGNHPANPLLSESEHLQVWGGEDVATLLHHLFSRHHLWLLQPPRDRAELPHQETTGLLETPLQ